MTPKLKVIFSKTGSLRFISHLDLMRLFARASRRADLAVTVTKGYSPHLKFSITKALKLGVESRAEEAVFYMDVKITPVDFREAMNSMLPEGATVKAVEEIN